MSEVWKAIPGYEEYYEVSDLGRVRSLDRRVRCRADKTRLLPGRMLKLSTGRKGYPEVSLKVDGHRVLRGAHQLVMLAFIGSYPNGMEICHNDGDKLNASLENLRYDTRSNNLYDRVRHGDNWQVLKTHCPQGHEYTPENTYRAPGWPFRRCKICMRTQAQESYRRRKSAAAA